MTEAQAKEIMREVNDMSRRIITLQKRRRKVQETVDDGNLDYTSRRLASLSYEIDTLVELRNDAQDRAKAVLYT